MRNTRPGQRISIPVPLSARAALVRMAAEVPDGGEHRFVCACKQLVHGVRHTGHLGNPCADTMQFKSRVPQRAQREVDAAGQVFGCLLPWHAVR